MFHDLFRYNSSLAFQHPLMFNSDSLASMSGGSMQFIHTHTQTYSRTNRNNSSPAIHRCRWKGESSQRIAVSFKCGPRTGETSLCLGWFQQEPVSTRAPTTIVQEECHMTVLLTNTLFLPNIMYRFNNIFAMSLAFNTGPKEQEIDYSVS